MSSISIINKALALLGCNRITSLADNTSEAKAASNIYNDSLKSILAECCWNFACKRVLLNQLTTIPDWSRDGMNTYFQLPSDFVAVFEVKNPEAKWRIEGDTILANTNEFGILYVYFCVSCNKYTASFAEAFAYKLAAEMCYELTNSSEKAHELLQFYKGEFLPIAKAKNSQQKSPPEVKDDYWVNSIFHGVQG